MSVPRPLLVPREREDPVRDAVEEVPVVRHEDDGAREVREAVLEHLQRREVEVVRGLVEDEEVRLPQHEPGEEEPALLAAREAAHLHVPLLLLEEEPVEIAPDVDEGAAVLDVVALGADRPRDRRLRVEALAPLLERDGLEVLRAEDLPRVGLLGSEERADERRLAAAVGPEEADPAVRRDEEVEVREEDVLSVRLADPLRLDEPLRVPLRTTGSPGGRSATGFVSASCPTSVSSAPALWIRACCFVERAFAPRRSHSVSRRSRFLSDDSRCASVARRSSFTLRYVA